MKFDGREEEEDVQYKADHDKIEVQLMWRKKKKLRESQSWGEEDVVHEIKKSRVFL